MNTGKLSAATLIRQAYWYDESGNRVRKTTTGGATYYQYGPAGEILAENNAFGAPTHDYVYLAGKVVAKFAEAGTAPVYFHHDVLGNTRAQTNASGSVVMRADYQPYGASSQSGSATEKRLFTGKERDETGLDYFGARYYDPSLGRFLSIDPAGPQPDSPETYNRYAYCLNNPYKFVDPDGEWATLYSGEPVSSAEAMVPVWGSARQAYNDLIDGQFISGGINLASACSDVFGVKAIVTGTAKGIAKDVVLSAAKKEAHANKADDRPATLYEKYDKNGNFLKHGVTKHEDPTKRYTKKQIDGGTVIATDRGPRREMLKKERELVERQPGPDNHEPWAGRRSGE